MKGDKDKMFGWEDLVVLWSDGEVSTSSHLVAEKFGKSHSEVCSVIDNLDPYVAHSNDLSVQTRWAPDTGDVVWGYRITRNGFTILMSALEGGLSTKVCSTFLYAFGEMELSRPVDLAQI